MAPNGLPHFAKGEVVKGFGRGSKQLGIPTANYPEQIVKDLPREIQTGVYFGFAKVEGNEEEQNGVHKMVMSIGWNPFYKNEIKSMETHILHDFNGDFYGKQLKTVMVGYIRPEKSFNSLEELIDAIKSDINYAQIELDKPEYLTYKCHDFFTKTE